MTIAKKNRKYLKTRARGILRFLQTVDLFRLLLVTILLIVMGAFGMAAFEPDTSLLEGFWFSIVTLTTVGYGDITPVTLAGRLIGIMLMFLGIGIILMFTANIASIFVNWQLRKERGMGSYNFDNHVILCQWNFRAQEILQELRSDPRFEATPIVLIADISIKPVDDEDLYFIQGDLNEKNLRRANLEKASTVIILGDDCLDASARDAEAVLATLTVKSINPNAYTIVELIDGSNVQHCERAHANEIIVGSEFNSRLISRAALDHGISEVLADLLSNRLGHNDFFKVSVPEIMANKSFIEIFSEMKRIGNSIVLAVQKGENGAIISNPEPDIIVEQGDQLFVISKGLPELFS